MLKYGVCIWLPILERPWWRHATIEKPYTFRFKLTLPAMSNIAFCSKAFGRKTWVIGNENPIIQKKNGFRFKPICSTPVLTTDNIICYIFFLGLTILTILYKRYAGKRVRFADRVWQPFLCRFILINDYIHFVILTKKSKLHFL